jgi:hypothetical protein
MRWFLLSLAASVLAAQTAGDDLKIKYVDIIHHSHTDVGFTDQPTVCREMQERYLDAAIDAATHNRRFFWTAEAMLSVDAWWRDATPARREQLLSLIRSGQVEIMAMPFNQTPFMNAAEWGQALRWVPQKLWCEFHPQVAMQNDVNGMPRAGAVRLLNLGIRYLYMGINGDNGGPPFRRPSAFWWKMPDGRRMFVWLGDTYGAAYGLFEPKEWRRGPVPGAGDTAYRPPRAGEVLRTDEASLRAAHKLCVARLKRLEKDGYPYERVLYSYTNQWRYDNDPPFPALLDFVEAWNRLGLKPALRLTTPSVALAALEKEAGGRMPVHEGEWTDWWANGSASGPREVAGSRLAKRLLEAAQSPVWGPPTPGFERQSEAILKDLCLFDEHTWGSSNSVAVPDSLDAVAQYAEKSMLAYRPMARAEWLLSQRARTRLVNEPEGLYVTNTAAAPYTGWVRFPAMALRGDFKSLVNPKTGEKTPIEFERGLKQWERPRKPEDLAPDNTTALFADNVPRQVARFWVRDLPAGTTVPLRLSGQDVASAVVSERPRVTVDEHGWPQTAIWSGMKQPLFTAGTGDLLTLTTQAFAPRWVLRDRAAKLDRTLAAESETTVERTPHTTVYSQRLTYPRLKWAVRRLEIWNGEPRARLTLRFNRISSDDPAYYFVNFAFPVPGKLPEFSNAGMPFVPFRDQLPGTCRDYFAIDGWAHYAAGADGDWLWVSRDAPLVTVGGPHTQARITEPPADPHRLMAMVFDSGWYTNFVGNEHGVMEFEFDLAWRERLPNAAALADTLVSQPVVLINPAARETPVILENLYRP